MFDTLRLKNMNKLVKGKIRDFTSPEAFHTVKVKRLCSNQVKASTQVCSKFPVPIQALSGHLPIQPRKLSDRTIPVVRTLFFARKAFTEYTELFQSLFQELRGLYLLTCGKCQKRILHSEVCPNALTCRWQRFGRSVIC